MKSSDSTSVLRINQGTSEPLQSKEELAFYSKLEHVEQLTKELSVLEAEISKAKSQILSAVGPLYKKIHALKIKKLLVFDALIQTKKLSKSQTDMVNTFFEVHLIPYLKDSKSDPILHEMFSRYVGQSFETYAKQKKKLKYIQFQKIFHEATGEMLDFSNENEAESTYQEAYARLQDMREEAFQRFFDEEDHKSASEKQKKKKSTSSSPQDLPFKSMRNLYISLMKRFHPDAETNEERKKEKEIISKQIVEAYRKRNIFQLLKINAQNSQSSVSISKEFDPQVLTYFSKILSEERKNLKNQIEDLKYHHRDLYHQMVSKHASPKKYLQKITEPLKNEISTLQFYIGLKDFKLKEHREMKTFLLDEMENMLNQTLGES
jgi:hypothetical protein